MLWYWREKKHFFFNISFGIYFFCCLFPDMKKLSRVALLLHQSWTSPLFQSLSSWWGADTSTSGSYNRRCVFVNFCNSMNITSKKSMQLDVTDRNQQVVVRSSQNQKRCIHLFRQTRSSNLRNQGFNQRVGRSQSRLNIRCNDRDVVKIWLY